MPFTEEKEIRFVEGARLAQNIYTHRGSLLLEKGTRLTSKEMELLEAFMIIKRGLAEPEIINPDPNESTNNKNEPPLPTGALLSPGEDFIRCSREVMALFHKLGLSIQKGLPELPIRPIQAKLEALLQISQNFSPLYSNLLFANDNPYYRHSLLVALSSYKLAEWYGYPATEWVSAAMAGLLHDIGKFRLVDGKDADLSRCRVSVKEEIALQSHPLLGYELIRNNPVLGEGIKLAVLQHHEQMNSQGYPLGLPAEQIHPLAKIVAVTNTYHRSLTTPARTASETGEVLSSPYAALAMIESSSFGQLDPAIAQRFINKTTSIQQGCSVQLSDQREGIIVFTHPSSPTRPWVKVHGGEIVNLSVEKHLTIDKILLGKS